MAVAGVLGTATSLPLLDGFPTRATSALVYDHLDFLRGVEVFLDFLPAASLEAMRLGLGHSRRQGPARGDC